jgi:penicillin G amidase
MLAILLAKLSRWLVKLVNVGLWVLTVLLAVFIAYRVTTLPKTGGEMSVPGLRADTSITRDSFGVPHIRAASHSDAVFTLGFVHGQDRLWQLEMHRRIARAELAEILGAPALQTDKFLRTLGVLRNATAIYSNLDAETQALVRAYADGINAAVGLTRESPVLLSPEFIALNTRPGAWTPQDVVAWQTMMAWELSGNMPRELLRFDLASRMSGQQLSQLLPTDPEQELPDLAAFYSALKANSAGNSSSLDIAGFLHSIPASAVEGIGSNQWVVSGKLSSSGKPLLANDPHLALTTPALWYLAHLSAPGLEVIGGTVPGLPYILAGRSDVHAWGLTTNAMDTQDVYLERLTPGKTDTYDTAQGPAQFEIREERIRVKGAAEVKLKVRTSAHGPIISDVHAPMSEGLRLRSLGQSFVMALRWSALDPKDFTVRAGLKANRAKDWNEFNKALDDFSSPPQNFTYANNEGFSAMMAVGRAPIRHSNNPLRGLAPAPGWDPIYDWQGWVARAQLPYSEAPAGGVLINANNRMEGGDASAYLGAEWALPYRYNRIRDQIKIQSKHDVKSMVALQSDQMSLMIKALLPALLKTRPLSSAGADALALLADWDGTMSVDAAAPAIALAWVDQLRRSLVVDEVGSANLQRIESLRSSSDLILKALTQPSYASWCDDTRTPALERCGDVLSTSLDLSLNRLSKQFGKSMDSWRLGDLSSSLSEHRPFGKNPMLAKLFDLKARSGGDTFTVNVARNDPWHDVDPFAVRWAASYRAVYDLGDVDRSVFIMSTGQSGHRLSPHYSDLLGRWSANDPIPMLTTKEAIDRSAESMLMLKPVVPK